MCRAKKIIRITASVIVLLTLCVCFSGCQNLEGFEFNFKSIVKALGFEAENNAQNTKVRIENAQNNATNALKQYTINLSLEGQDSKAENGTIFVVEVDDLYIQYKYADNVFDTSANPDVLPSSDPLKGNDNYTKITGSLADKIPDNVSVYIPKKD